MHGHGPQSSTRPRRDRRKAVYQQHPAQGSSKSGWGTGLTPDVVSEITHRKAAFERMNEPVTPRAGTPPYYRLVHQPAEKRKKKYHTHIALSTLVGRSATDCRRMGLNKIAVLSGLLPCVGYSSNRTIWDWRCRLPLRYDSNLLTRSLIAYTRARELVVTTGFKYDGRDSQDN